MQVWTKPDAKGLPRPPNEQLYQITFGQFGGSPTGLPTGPIHDAKGLAQEPL